MARRAPAWVAPLAVLAAAAAVRAFDAPSEVRDGLTIFVLVGGLWLTETVHLSLAALLVPLLGVGFGLVSVADALAPFAHPVIAIFFGGFALASALTAQRLDRWLAAGLLRTARGNLRTGTLLLLLATSVFSMWISNTATVAMMLPLALGVLAQIEEASDSASAAASADDRERTAAFVLLGLAWAANVGGMATLVGSPPNAIAAAELGWGFRDWLRVGVPAWLLAAPTALALLWWRLKPTFPARRADAPVAPAEVWTRHKLLTMAIFFATVVLWIFGAPLAARLGIDANADAAVALLAAVALGVTGCTTWPRLQRDTNWGLLILFGGGIGLSNLLKVSGTSAWLGERLAGWLPGAAPLVFAAVVAVFVVFATELVSNTASAAILVPLLVPLAAQAGIATSATAALIALAASCAFMLPVATPPNALVYGSGRVDGGVMRRVGLRMNLAAVGVLLLWWVLVA